MKLHKLFIILALFSLLLPGPFSVSFAQSEFSIEDTTLVDRIIDHCASLSSFSPRVAGTAEDLMAIKYIKGKIEDAGVKAVSEEVRFKSFSLESGILRIGESEFIPSFITLDPFNKPLSYYGKAVIFSSEREPSEELTGRVIVTDHPAMSFILLPYNPQSVICLDPADFANIAIEGETEVALEMAGKINEYQTENICALVGNNPVESGEIVITAHIDSNPVSPGANDNATGVGAALEMLSYLKDIENDLHRNVRIIFFGAEELGMVGSREYVSSHQETLERIVAVINLDTFGGDEAPYIATARGTGDLPAGKPQNRLDGELAHCSLESSEGNWRIQHPSILPLIMSTYFPEWLQQRVDTISRKLDMEPLNMHLMSDHLSFAQAGVPAISIQSRKHTIHSPGDKVEKLNRQSIASCYNLALSVVINLSLTED